jgi:hypothetical protein
LLYESATISDLCSFLSLNSKPPTAAIKEERTMSELNREDEIGGNENSSVAGLDAQLTDLIEFIWACESTARREDRIEAAIKYGSK